MGEEDKWRKTEWGYFITIWVLCIIVGAIYGYTSSGEPATIFGYTFTSVLLGMILSAGIVDNTSWMRSSD